jgi:hypothetical protein
MPSRESEASNLKDAKGKCKVSQRKATADSYGMTNKKEDADPYGMTKKG